MTARRAFAWVIVLILPFWLPLYLLLRVLWRATRNWRGFVIDLVDAVDDGLAGR